MLPWRHKSGFGLELESAAVRLVELRNTSRGLQIAAARQEPLPPHAFAGVTMVDRDAISAAVSQACKPYRSRRLKVVTAICGEGVFVKSVPASHLDGEDAPGTLERLFAQHIPLAPEEVHADCQIFPGGIDGHSTQVLLAAAAKERVADLVSLLEGSGTSVAAMDISGLALANCYNRNYEPPEHDLAALIHLGGSTAHVQFVLGMVPLFTRDFEIRRGDVVAGSSAATPIMPESSVTPAADSTGADGTSVLLREIQHTFASFREIAPDRTVDRIYLSGTEINGLLDAMQRSFSVPAETFDAFRGMGHTTNSDLPGDSDASPFAVATGLALRALEEL